MRVVKLRARDRAIDRFACRVVHEDELIARDNERVDKNSISSVSTIEPRVELTVVPVSAMAVFPLVRFTVSEPTFSCGLSNSQNPFELSTLAYVIGFDVTVSSM